MRTATHCLLLILAILLPTATGWAQAPGPAPAAPAELKPTWFNPQTPEPGRRYPLAVVLESDEFSAPAHKFWVSTLFTRNYCQCIVTNTSDDWSALSVNDVLGLIDPLPGNVPADGKRLLLVADRKTGPLAMRMLEGFPDRIAGVVLVSARPIELTRDGQATVWLPRPAARGVPMWIVIGTSPGPAARTLKMWRAFESLMPADASITIDTRLGRGLEPLLPDKAVTTWLEAVAAKKTPATGPDAQAQQLKQTYAASSQAIDRLLQQQGFAAPAGQKLIKAEGPMTVSIVAPQGWVRVPRIELPYNPRGKVIGDDGQPQGVPPNPFLQIGISPTPPDPKNPGPLHGLVLATEWRRSAEDLLAYSNKRLTSKGYIPFVIKQWTSSGWTIELSAIAYVYEERWQSWLALSAARPGTNDNPAAPMVMIFNRADRPDANAMVAALNRLRQTVQADWTGPLRPDAPTPIEE